MKRRFNTVARKIFKGATVYFVFAGIVAHVVVLIGAVYLFKSYELTPRQFIIKAAEKAGVDSDVFIDAIAPSAMFPNHQFDGELKSKHPRILMPELASWNGPSVPDLMAKRQKEFKQHGINKFDPCPDKSIPAQAVCWVSSGDASVVIALINKLKNFQLETPDVESKYGNAWVLAFAYDLASTYPDFSDEGRVIIEAKLVQSLSDYLLLLNDSGPSLWHGRSTLAASAWLVAVAITPDNEKEKQLITQAQAHFLDVINALEITEGWPEGYNYWIQNRAFLLMLASSAYLNGLEASANHNRIKQVINRVGLWHLYATRPDDRIEGFGDEGSRVDLKDETRRVIDLIAQATGNPIFSQYSRYLELLHKNESYYRGYRWGMQLFNDPNLFSVPQIHRDLSNFSALPKSEWFGKNAFNQFFVRSGWSDKDTFISYRAGNTLTHHGHYDAGHFTIFKGAPLAINSSVYSGFTGENRLNYSIRTIAKNSLLILKPGEKVKPNRFFKQNVSDGGQRIVLPTGSTIDNVSHWKANLNNGKHYEGGRILSYESVEDEYVYIESDLTAAYNNTEYDDSGDGGKVESVKRSLVYLPGEDQLIVYDKVKSTNDHYVKKWLLHSVNEPVFPNKKLLKGREHNGIYETQAKQGFLKNGDNYLEVQSLLPEKSVFRIVGGPDYQFYVETDGDDSDLDGVNFSADGIDKPWFDVGYWRLELQPTVAQKADEFMVLLSPSFDKPGKRFSTLLDIKGGASGLETDKHAVIFIKDGMVKNIEIGLSTKVDAILVFGLPENEMITVTSGSMTKKVQSNDQGVLSFDAKLLSSAVKLIW